MMLMIQAEELGKEPVTGLFPIKKNNVQAKLENIGKIVPFKRVPRKLEEMIRVHAEVVKSIKNAA